MQQLDMDQLVELEALCGSEVNMFLARVSRSTIDRPGNIAQLMEMAENLGVPSGVFSSFVRLKLDIKDRSTALEDVVPLELVAQHLGLPMDQNFYSWLQRQAEEFSRQEAEYLEDLQQDGEDILFGE